VVLGEGLAKAWDEVEAVLLGVGEGILPRTSRWAPPREYCSRPLATVSGVPTSAVELPGAPKAVASGVQTGVVYVAARGGG
jgi:hypothetical protein